VTGRALARRRRLIRACRGASTLTVLREQVRFVEQVAGWRLLR
jgi:hypothetical protein